ncbi:MAG: EpsG family protein [Oscillospiraceae bacterium]|nr:EpsG family protein [Oscillospiraceae bacterium]
MLIYFFMLAGVIAAGIPLCSKKCGKAGRIIFCTASALVFVIISALRFQVGYDYNLYGGAYFNMQYATFEDICADKMEKGFLLPLYVLNLAFEEYYVVFIYTSIIIYPVVFYLICKNSSNPWISTTSFLCLGVFFNSMCFLRQFIAALIVTYAVQYLNKKQIWRFFVFVIAASVFHWSALIMLGMWILIMIKPGKIHLGIVTFGTVAFCFVSRSLMYWAIDNFYMYKDYDPATNPEASIGLPIWYTIMFGILFVISFIFRKRLIEKKQENSIYINCLMYTVVFEAMGTRHGILSRFAIIVYLPAVLYLVPDLVAVIKEYISETFELKPKRVRVLTILSACMGSLFAVGCYVMLMLNNYNGVVPYVSQMNRSTDIFVEEIAGENEEENWDDVHWDDEGYIDEEWEDEEWLDESGEDEDYIDEDWSEDEFDEEAFENEILEQLG